MTDEPRFPDDDLKVDFGEKVIRDPDFMARVRAEERRADERREQQMRERAEQARHDALAAFVAYPGHEIAHAWVCPSCTAVVTDRERHLDWHGALAATAAAASHADMWTRPIG